MGQDELSPELGGWLWGLAAGSRKRRWVGFRGVGQSAEGSTHTAGGGGTGKGGNQSPATYNPPSGSAVLELQQPRSQKAGLSDHRTGSFSHATLIPAPGLSRVGEAP